MPEYFAELVWTRNGQDFLGNRYSRKHVLRFDGGAEVPGSSSPHVVPTPMSDPSAVDPEEAFVASLSSCHMLWFLSVAAENRFCVDRYVDKAVGVMQKNAAGKLVIALVTLHPEVSFSGDNKPSRQQIDEMHRLAHGDCFIANSVKTEVRCEPLFESGDPYPSSSG